MRRESGSKNKPRRIILWGFYLPYRHLAYRIANADDIISLCDIYDIFGGGLLDFDFFHLDAYDTVDFQDTPDRSVLYLEAIGYRSLLGSLREYGTVWERRQDGLSGHSGLPLLPG